MDIYEEIVRLKKDGRSLALATIIECKGSSPQKQGTKMLVRDDGSVLGTLGGGCLEAEVIQNALMSLRDGTSRNVRFELTEKHGGLVCGGTVLVFIEPVIPEPALLILGAGHVGRALTKVAAFSGFRVTVIDDREEYANRDNLPDAHEILVRDFGDSISGVVAGSCAYIVIATRGHNHDLEALKTALRTDARYIGLVGSRRKRTLLFKTLSEEGFSEDDIGRIIIPVGLPIHSTTSEEIAISIMAQMIQQRRTRVHEGYSARTCGRFIEEDGTVKTAPPCQ